jgi:nucleotidyltransferase substrate binding protein (TIGR01987 family)
MPLDLSSLQRALDSLERAISRTLAAPDDEELRDAVIQRFEYTYELCWKMLKRQLEREMPTPAEADRMPFSELVREGAERGLVDAPERWLLYRHQRNVTSHAYDGEKARGVYETALAFAPDARALLAALSRRT